eukprot:4885855-Prymnesium_polylepis.2
MAAYGRRGVTSRERRRRLASSPSPSRLALYSRCLRSIVSRQPGSGASGLRGASGWPWHWLARRKASCTTASMNSFTSSERSAGACGACASGPSTHANAS